MSKSNRKRSIAVTFRMSEPEYKVFKGKVSESGLTQQDYIIAAVNGTGIPSSDEITGLQELNKTFASFERQLRGLATNVNQMAHVANSKGIIPSGNKLDALSEQLRSYRKESETIRKSIRSSIERLPRIKP